MGVIMASSSAISASRSAHPVGQRAERRLGRRRHRVARTRGTQALGSRDELGDREALEAGLELVGRAVGELTHLDESLHPSGARRALGDEQDAQRFDPAVAALGPPDRFSRQGGSGRFHRVEGVGLACVATGLAVRAVDLDHDDAGPRQEAGEASAIRTRAFDTHLGECPEGLEPGQQRLVAGWVRLEGLGSEQASDVVERGSHMDLAMGVDATDDGARRFYDGHGHPFLSLSGEGWHGRPVKE
jgi:hypothetical protein